MQFEWIVKRPSGIYRNMACPYDGVTVFYDPLTATFDDPAHSIDKRRFVTVAIPRNESC